MPVSGVIPSSRKQLESDIRFDMFDHVQPGHGNGSDNKLYLMQEARDRVIRYAGPMNMPGSYIGPISGVAVPPWQLQRTYPLELAEDFQMERIGQMKTASHTMMKAGERSVGLLGSDTGYPYPVSSKSLKRSRESVFEPVIRNDFNWERVKPATGYQLNKHKFRRLSDGQRAPEELRSFAREMGGPTLNKRRSLEVILL